MLSRAEVYTGASATKHSANFAGNTLDARVGVAVLASVSADDAAQGKHEQRLGGRLLEGLQELQRRYPHVIREVRGTGFMLGIDFGIDRRTFGTGPGSMMGIMAEQELLTPAIASYLLNRQGLRVAPTLNGASVIRIEPPLIVDEEH